MPDTAHVEAEANRAEHSRSLTLLARAGFIGYGLLHVLVAGLAVQIALGRTATEGDQSGAFAVLARNPVGRIVLGLVVLGLAAMAVWQALTAAVGHRDRQGTRRVLERIGSAARVVVYAALAWSAGRMVVGAGSSGAAKQQNATAGALSSGGGRVLVVVAGVAVFAVAVGLAVFGLTRKFEESLWTGRMSPATRKAAAWLGQIGYAGKGAGYAVVGVLLVWAAVTYDPNKSRGLDAALRTLAGTGFGWLPLGLIALGFAAFGGFCAVQARYRKT
jgi:hypothetical protein